MSDRFQHILIALRPVRSPQDVVGGLAGEPRLLERLIGSPDDKHPVEPEASPDEPSRP